MIGVITLMDLLMTNLFYYRCFHDSIAMVIIQIQLNVRVKVSTSFPLAIINAIDLQISCPKYLQKCLV